MADNASKTKRKNTHTYIKNKNENIYTLHKHDREQPHSHIMSGKAATGAKRARANTEAETHEEDPVENELKQEFHELKKVIKILTDI